MPSLFWFAPADGRKRFLTECSPGAVVHVGLAGARGVEPPALVLGSESVYTDVVDPGSSFPRVERVEPDARLLARARALLPEAHVLPIATSGRVTGGAGCPVEAMEGFGVLRACALADVPALCALSARVRPPPPFTALSCVARICKSRRLCSSRR